MIEIIGDILTPSKENPSPIVCHQVNCMGVMGSGFARQIRSKFPNVYLAYKKKCEERTPKENLGTVQFCTQITSAGLIIANIFGQEKFGTDCRHTDYNALRTAFREIAVKCSNRTIRIPYRLGCGLGGGDWNIVKNIIEEELISKGIQVEFWKLPNEYGLRKFE